MKREILFSQEEIQARVQEIADILNKEYKDKNPVIIGLLTGSFVFCADLLRKLDFPFEFEFLYAKSYLNSTESSGNVQVGSINFNIKDRDVILIDDIIDTGNTLSALIEKLEEEGVKSITSVMLFDKPSRREKDIKPDITGFEVENYFLVGYGMDDDKGVGRHYPYVLRMKED